MAFNRNISEDESAPRSSCNYDLYVVGANNKTRGPFFELNPLWLYKLSTGLTSLTYNGNTVQFFVESTAEPIALDYADYPCALVGRGDCQGEITFFTDIKEAKESDKWTLLNNDSQEAYFNFPGKGGIGDNQSPLLWWLLAGTSAVMLSKKDKSDFSKVVWGSAGAVSTGVLITHYTNKD